MTRPLTFGEGGTALPRLGAGWAPPEHGFSWSTGKGASLTAAIPPGEGDLFLELALNPFTAPGQQSRRLRVTVDGHLVGTDSLQGSGTVGYRLPPDIAGPTVRIALEHDIAPSAAALGLSNDTRALGFMLFTLRLIRHPPRLRADITVLPPFPLPPDSAARHRAIRAATGLVPRALAETFESLGHNCEFGMFQRHLEAEPLGLLRFAAITLDDLLAALDADFADLGADLAVLTFPDAAGRQEYLVRDERHHISLHTTRTTEDSSTAEIESDYRTHLPFLATHLRGRLTEGTHIHVFQRPGQLTRSQAVPLWNRLQARGPNALLYVDQDPNLPSGAVEQLGYGLFHGKLATMAPHQNVGLLDLPAWLSLCANAHRLWKKASPSAVA